MNPPELLDTFVALIRESNMTQEEKRQSFHYIRIIRTMLSNGVHIPIHSQKCSDEFKDP